MDWYVHAYEILSERSAMRDIEQDSDPLAWLQPYRQAGDPSGRPTIPAPNMLRQPTFSGPSLQELMESSDSSSDSDFIFDPSPTRPQQQGIDIFASNETENAKKLIPSSAGKLEALVDSRERMEGVQLAERLRGVCESGQITLGSGDLIVAYNGSVRLMVERKTYQDAINSCGNGHLNSQLGHWSEHAGPEPSRGLPTPLVLVEDVPGYIGLADVLATCETHNASAVLLYPDCIERVVSACRDEDHPTRMRLSDLTDVPKKRIDTRLWSELMEHAMSERPSPKVCTALKQLLVSVPVALQLHKERLLTPSLLVKKGLTEKQAQELLESLEMLKQLI